LPPPTYRLPRTTPTTFQNKLQTFNFFLYFVAGPVTPHPATKWFFPFQGFLERLIEILISSIQVGRHSANDFKSQTPI
ncbi:MAG: hypothetical protein QNL52_00445, partial [Synechococcus sp. ChBW.bin.23]